MPGDENIWKTWPWFLGLNLTLLVLAFVPPILHSVLVWDVALARWANSLLGRNPMVDTSLWMLNNKHGDILVVLGFGALFLAHIVQGGNRAEIMRRLAFWGWVALVFVTIYQLQRVIEVACHRDSPSRALAGWYKLREYVGHNVKVSNTHSYPSGHAMAYWFVALLAVRRYRLMGLLMLLIAATCPTTRIITGAHWPTDIFLGSVPLALLGSALCWETAPRRLIDVFELILNGLWRVVTIGRGRRGLDDRLQGAWREFMDDIPLAGRDELEARILNGIPNASVEDMATLSANAGDGRA